MIICNTHILGGYTNMNSNNFDPMQIAIILLTLATAIIHLALGISGGLVMFILNGIGYIVLVVALFLPQFKAQRNLIRWGLIAFAAVTVIGWVAIGMRTSVAYIDKLIEVALIVLLFIEGRQQSSTQMS
jgi:hypothetical protein